MSASTNSILSPPSILVMFPNIDQINRYICTFYKPNSARAFALAASTNSFLFPPSGTSDAI